MSAAPDSASHLGYAPRATRNFLRGRSRLALAAVYLGLTFFPCLVIVMAGQLPMPAIAATFLAYAFALFPTYWFDHYFLGGRGFHSPLSFGMFIGFTAALLWPIPLLSAAPGVLRSARWRRALQLYTAAFILFASATAWAMIRYAHLFFG